VYFDDDMVSRRHARLFVERGVWHVEDLGSRNGTRLNGEVVHRSAVDNGAELVLYPGGPALRLEIRGGGRRVTRAVLERAPAELH
jgi:pSer/pThr/pTyr-binding forkhead associated (FHA) protein